MDRCPGANSYWSGSRCVTCTAPKNRWDTTTRTCKCPLGKISRGNICCNPKPTNASWISGDLNSGYCWRCDNDYRLKNGKCVFCDERKDCEHGFNKSACRCNPAPVSGLCNTSETRTWWNVCHNGRQTKYQNTFNACRNTPLSTPTVVTDNNGNPVTRACSLNCPGNQVIINNECKCRISGQIWRSPSACHTDQNYLCRCEDDSKTLRGGRCEPRCQGGSQFRASDCTCYCTGANTHYNGSRCVTCSSTEQWDTATRTCKRRVTSTPQSASCPPAGEPNLTRQVGTGRWASCHCPSGKHAVGQNPTLCCSRETCPEGKTRSEDSCTCSPTPCTTGLVLCGGVCIEGKDCPGVTEKVCPTEDCPPPRDPQGLPLATPATCEGE